jgi:DNA polymerase-4
MDAFYAAVEQRDNPDLRGKPLAVGGDGRRGIVATASYEARAYGVRSAMPSFQARDLCPTLLFVPARFDAYKEVSQQIRAIFEEYTDLIEPLSLDEAFLDVTENKFGILSATQIAEEIRAKVYERTQLTCSAGVSYCKFIAKVASDMNKPDGITVVPPIEAEQFLEDLPIQKFFGVGKVTAKKMVQFGITKGKELKKWDKLTLAQNFGKAGLYYYNIVRGLDKRPVRPSRVRKSIGVERTLSEDLGILLQIQPLLSNIVDKLYERLVKADNFGRTLTLKLKTHDFQILTRSETTAYFITDKTEIQQIAQQLLLDNQNDFEKIRLIGLTASNLKKELENSKYGIQLEIDFEEN